MGRWPIVGALSTYREGRLAVDAVRSLLVCCDQVLVLEGPVGDVPERGEPTVLFDGRKPPGGLLRRNGGPWASDAVKRTVLLRWAQARVQGPFWLVVLDGDEVLLWPELLPSYLDHARQLEQERGPGAVKLKLVQYDDVSCEVQETGCRLLPGHLIHDYVLSSYQVRLKGMSTVLTLPLGPALRPPVAGEPHIVHRPYLRPTLRNAPEARLSELERDDLVELGMTHLERPQLVVPGR